MIQNKNYTEKIIDCYFSHMSSCKYDGSIAKYADDTTQPVKKKQS